MDRPGDGPRTVIDDLRRAAGADAVHQPRPGEWSVHGAPPRAVVQPTTAQGVAAVLALCSVRGWTVEPAGAGTWLDHGCTTARSIDVVLSTRRLSGRITTEPGDLVVGADAGVPLAALQQRLAHDRQELPLDPPAAAAATLGAVISHAAAGPLRAGSGTPRDYVLGLQVATGDGRLIRFGGRVVKNVAGYDVVRLLTGSRGSLGMITDAWLRLHARPADDRTFVLEAEPANLLEVVMGLRAVHPAAVELLAPSTASAVAARSAWLALVRLRGGREELADAVDRMRGIVGGLSLTEAGADVWKALGSLEAAASPLIRIASLPAEAGPLLDRCRRFIAGSGNELGDWHLAVHGTVGIARLWPARPIAAGAAEHLAAALGELRREAEAANASVLVEAAKQASPLAVRGAVDPAIRRLEAELKRVMDPAGILGSLA